MKTKKVLALVVLAAFLISIVPFAAFAAPAPRISPDATIVEAPDETASASKNITDVDTDGVEYTIVINAGAGEGVYLDTAAPIFIGSDRVDGVQFFFENKGDGADWKAAKDTVGTDFKGGDKSKVGGFIQKITLAELGVNATTKSVSVDVKVASSLPGKINVAAGIGVGAGKNLADTISELLTGKTIEDANGTQTVFGRQKYVVEFTAADPTDMDLKADPAGTTKPANGVDSFKIKATVYTNGVPAGGKDVTFSIKSGTGANLTATRVTTSVAGLAETKVYSSRAGEVVVQAKTSGNQTKEVAVNFSSTGIVSIKAESDNNQKVARNASKNNNYKTFNFSAYDASGNRMDFLKQIPKEDRGAGKEAEVKKYMALGHDTVTKKDVVGLTATVVSKPSGANLKDGDITYNVHSSGNGQICVPYDKLNKDGDYEVKIHLVNGVSVSYKFNVKDQGDIVKMILSYGSSSYSAGTVLPQPEVKYQDAEGYEVSENFVSSGNLKLSISDASFMDGAMTINGQFKLKDDKSGVVTMTAVDTSENLVATQVLNIEKAASYLKLTPQSVGAVGGEVNVEILLVDVDGKPASSGLAAAEEGTNATVIAKPAGAIASASSIDAADFKKGKASVKVSSNMEGDVTLQVIITEVSIDKVEDAGEVLPAYGGRTYTGAVTVSFGKASSGSGQMIFIIGSPSFVSGNKVYASESPSFIDNGRTFLGVRDMGTSIGATVEWDQASQTASLSKDGITVKVTVGASKISVTKNGVTSEIEIDAPAQNKNGRVYLPFRAVLEAFNYTVSYDQATNSIVCTL